MLNLETETAFTVTEVGRRLRMSQPSIYRFMASGKLGYVQLGRRRIVLADQLEAFLEGCRRDPQTDDN